MFSDHLTTKIDYPRDSVPSRRGETTDTDVFRLSATQPITELAAGTKIGRYIVENRVGKGGMGVVYSARDTELHRLVALKIVPPSTDAAATEARLRREAMAMARLSHGNAVPVFDFGTYDGHPFLAMELIKGEPLRTWVIQPRPWRDVAQLFAKAGRGLAATHAAGMLHRDFKPDNVMVDASNEPHLTDFGLARELAFDDAVPDALDADNSAARELAASPEGELPRLTAWGALAGTVMYMAPEHVRGEQGRPQIDQFSYCVSFFEVLYGTHPFQPAACGDAAGPAEPARTPLAGQTIAPDRWVAEIRAGRVVKPGERRGVPRWLHAAVVRGLAFDPAERWPSMRALVDAIERGLRRRRRRIIAVGATIAIAAAAGVAVMILRHPPLSCLAVAARQNDAATVAVCSEEFERTGDPAAGVKLADALRVTGKRRDAEVIAKELLATPKAAAALYVLGKIADGDGRRDEALRWFRSAGALHRAQGELSEAAADHLAAAKFAPSFVDQLVDLDQAARDARRAADRRDDKRAVARRIEAFCHLAAARTLSTIGARTAALHELARAEGLVTRQADSIEVARTRSEIHQNLGEHVSAIAALEQALQTIPKANAGPMASATATLRLNLAYSLAEASRLDEATTQLETVNVLDVDDDLLVDRQMIESLIAARAGDPVRAAELVDKALASLGPDAFNERLELEAQRAEIALQHGDLAAAESWARQAIASIEKLRSPHAPVELQSWMVTERRVPYEVLFASLAGRGNAAQALVVFDQVRGLGVLAALAREEPTAPPGTASKVQAGFPIDDLARLLPLLQNSSLATPASMQRIVDTARTRSLLALVVARGELWRIVADRGQLDVAHIGPLATLRPLFDRFRDAPGDRAAADQLGSLLVPRDLAQPSDLALHIVLDDALGWLPVAALRVGDRRLISARPVVIAARPSSTSCTPPPRTPHRVVRIGASNATPAALLAPDGERLHLSVPVETDALGTAVVLQDSRLRALEIAGRGTAPAQVVLEMASSAPTGTATLAMAYVAAGSDQVIATLRPVRQATIERLSEQLHRTDPGDLILSLARIQRASEDDDVLEFAAFGRASCSPRE